MRYLCIDLGDKRTGLAVGDSVMRMAAPLDVLEVAITERGGDALLDAIMKAIDDQFSPHTQAEIVIGLPLNMTDGSEGPRAAIVRAFAARIVERLKPAREMRFHDERLSSAAADDQMARTGLTHKQKKLRRDALAAAAILNDYLAALGR